MNKSTVSADAGTASASSACWGRDIGEASNVEQLRRLLAPFVGECPIRFETKGPIEVRYESTKAGGVLVFK